MDVVDVRVGVGRHDRRIFVLRQQIQHLVVVFVRIGVRAVRAPAAAERNMYAEDHHLVLRHETQILFEPRVLCGGESAFVVGAGLAAVDDVVHRDHVYVAAVERVVDRPEITLVFRPCRLFVGRREFVVVVSDRGEDGHSRLLRLQGDDHVGEQRPFVVDVVAQRDAVAGNAGRGRIFADLSSGLLLETHGMRRLVDLGIADADQVEPLFGCGERFEREVVARRSGLEPGEEAGEFVGLVDAHLVSRRQRIEDEARVGVARECVTPFGVGGRTGVSVAYDHPFDGIAVRILDVAVGVAVGGRFGIAVVAVAVRFVSALVVRAGGESGEQQHEQCAVQVFQYRSHISMFESVIPLRNPRSRGFA